MEKRLKYGGKSKEVKVGKWKDEENKECLYICNRKGEYMACHEDGKHVFWHDTEEPWTWEMWYPQVDGNRVYLKSTFDTHIWCENDKIWQTWENDNVYLKMSQSDLDDLTIDTEDDTDDIEDTDNDTEDTDDIEDTEENDKEEDTKDTNDDEEYTDDNTEDTDDNTEEEPRKKEKKTKRKEMSEEEKKKKGDNLKKARILAAKIKEILWEHNIDDLDDIDDEKEKKKKITELYKNVQKNKLMFEKLQSQAKMRMEEE